MDNETPSGFLQMINQVNGHSLNLKEFIKKHSTSPKKKDRLHKSDAEQMRRLRIQNRKVLQQFDLLKEQAKQMKKDKAQLTKRYTEMVRLNDSLSEALGSCSNCWGSDPACKFCLGHGIPGWRNINKRMFNIYILPCLEKLYHLNKQL
jgi:hypothetical protein